MKRLFDVTLTALTAVFWLPIMLVLVMVVWLTIGHPVFFVQSRPGLRGRPFRLVKFRTMPERYEAHGRLLSDAERIGTFGRFLRATSLDELPELWNVVKGDMSLVGPRPLLMEYLPLYSDEQRRRHEVRPGLTGWAQVNGRNALSWRERFEKDVWYVDHASFLLDIRILLLTFIKVLGRDGINSPGEATMPRFTGSEDDEK